MVGGVDLGLELAEELGRLAPFGMGNPGVRLMVPSARVRDVRTMGEEGKHARFSLHSGCPPGARRRLRPLAARGRRGRRRRRRGAARGQPLERLGRAAGRPARALPADAEPAEEPAARMPTRARRVVVALRGRARLSTDADGPKRPLGPRFSARRRSWTGEGGGAGDRLGGGAARRARLQRRRGPCPGRAIGLGARTLAESGARLAEYAELERSRSWPAASSTSSSSTPPPIPARRRSPAAPAREAATCTAPGASASVASRSTPWRPSLPSDPS